MGRKNLRGKITHFEDFNIEIHHLQPGRGLNQIITPKRYKERILKCRSCFPSNNVYLFTEFSWSDSQDCPRNWNRFHQIWRRRSFFKYCRPSFTDRQHWFCCCQGIIALLLQFLSPLCTMYNVYFHLHRFVLMSWAEGGERPLIMLNGSFFFSPGEDYRINGDCQLPAITIKNTFSGNNVMLDNKRKTSQEFVQIFQMRPRTADGSEIYFKLRWYCGEKCKVMTNHCHFDYYSKSFF